MLAMKRCERMGDVVEVSMCAAKVLSCEVGWFVWGRRGENFCLRSGGRVKVIWERWER